jgi:hypothetical protein
MTQKVDWIGAYSSTPVRKFQEGGAMPAPEGAPMGPEAGGAPAGGDLEGMIAEYAQSRDPQLAVAICDMIVELMAQGGGAPGGAPAGPEGAPPMAKKGMKFKKGPVFKGTADKKKAKC